MATVLGRGSNQLVVAFFGARIEFNRTQAGVVTCTAGGQSETPASMKAVFSSGLQWFALPAPRQAIDLGPLFGQSFRFYEQHGQPFCVATHGLDLGMKESSASIQATMQIAKDWLTASGVT